MRRSTAALTPWFNLSKKPSRMATRKSRLLSGKVKNFSASPACIPVLEHGVGDWPVSYSLGSVSSDFHFSLTSNQKTEN